MEQTFVFRVVKGYSHFALTCKRPPEEINYNLFFFEAKGVINFLFFVSLARRFVVLCILRSPVYLALVSGRTISFTKWKAGILGRRKMIDQLK